MSNPFHVRWLNGWSFQTVLMEGAVQVEALGFCICLRTPVRPGESPTAAADRLVLAEDRRRRALHAAWLKGERLKANHPDGITPDESRSEEPASSRNERSLIRVAA